MKMNNKYKFYFLSIVAAVLILTAGCNRSGKQEEPEDGPTYGEIKIAVDETFQYIMDTEVSTFMSIYDRAKIHALYRPETEAINLLLQDSVRLVVAGRDLTPEEKKVIEDAEIVPRTIKIAYDAIALIVNPENTDTLISYDNVSKIFTKEISSWKQINPKSKEQDIQLVFDNSGSSSISYFKKLFGTDKFLSKNCFAEKSSEAVIDYVAQNKNALGIIGVGWISDKKDTTCLSFLRKIRVMEVAPADTMPGAGYYYKPFQAYIAQRIYPFWRTIYIISREPRVGLGSGFMSFVASDRGQRMFLKSGIVPATAPVRLVETYHQPL
jgi:phosphate transport system substrate-binding protein